MIQLWSNYVKGLTLLLPSIYTVVINTVPRDTVTQYKHKVHFSDTIAASVKYTTVPLVVPLFSYYYIQVYFASDLSIMVITIVYSV